MPILYLILVLAVIGFCLWLLTTYVPMSSVFKNIITAVVVIATLIWVLNMSIPLGGPMVGVGPGTTLRR